MEGIHAQYKPATQVLIALGESKVLRSYDLKALSDRFKRYSRPALATRSSVADILINFGDLIHHFRTGVVPIPDVIYRHVHVRLYGIMTQTPPAISLYRSNV